MTQLDAHPKRNTEGRSAIGIRCYVGRANESFSRTMTGRMTLMIIKKLDSKRPIWRTI